MKQELTRKLIACFGCKTVVPANTGECDTCGLDINNEIADRENACLYPKLTAIAFFAGALVLLITLFTIGAMMIRTLPATGVGAVIVALAGVAWLLASSFKPEYLSEPPADDLRSNH